MSFAVARPSIGGKSALAMAAAKKREAFSFPILSTEEIRFCLHEMGIAVDEDDLVKAKPEVVRNVYEQLIYECTGITKEELSTPRPCEDGAGGNIPKYEELHEESIPMLHYMRALNKLLVASGVHEGFTLRDMIRPDPVRLRRNLSGIINFQKYREEKIEQWAEHGRRTLELDHARLQLEAEQRELEAQLERERSLRAAEAPAIADLQRAVAELTASKAELNATASRLSAGIEEQKRTIAELKEGAVTAEVKAEGLREEIDAARAQVVSSPARLRADVEHSARLVEDAKAALAAAHGEAAAITRRREIVGKASKDVGKTLAALGELEIEVQRLKKAAKDAKAKATARDEKAAEAAEASAQAERMQKRVRAAEDKLAEHKHSAYVKTEATQRANAALREELAATQAELERAKAANRDAAARMAAVRAEHDRIQAAHNAEMAEMLSAMRHIQKTVADYHGRLFAALAEAGPLAP